MKLKDRLIEHFVERWWDEDTFQKCIKEKIDAAPVMWTWNTFGLMVSHVRDYYVLHTSKQMVPWLYTSEEEVREQVKAWNKSIKEYKEETQMIAKATPDKPKRKYNKNKKKETKE